MPPKATRKTHASSTAPLDFGDGAAQIRSGRLTRSASRELDATSNAPRSSGRISSHASADVASDDFAAAGTIRKQNKRGKAASRNENIPLAPVQEDVSIQPPSSAQRHDKDTPVHAPEDDPRMQDHPLPNPTQWDEEPALEIDYLDDMYRHAIRIIDRLSPPGASRCVIEQRLVKVREDGSMLRKTTMRDYDHLVKILEYFETELFANIPRTVRLLTKTPDGQEIDDGAWRPDDIIYTCNLAILAISMFPCRSAFQANTTLETLDDEFPEPLEEADTLQGGKYREIFELALDIRTQYLIAQLDHESSKTNFDSEEIIHQVFKEGDAMRGFAFVKLTKKSTASVGDRFNEICSCFRANFHDPAGIDELKKRHPWTPFCVKFAFWIRKVADEYHSSITDQGGVEHIIEALRSETLNKAPLRPSSAQSSDLWPVTPQSNQSHPQETPIWASVNVNDATSGSPSPRPEREPEPGTRIGLRFDTLADIAKLKRAMNLSEGRASEAGPSTEAKTGDHGPHPSTAVSQSPVPAHVPLPRQSQPSRPPDEQLPSQHEIRSYTFDPVQEADQPEQNTEGTGDPPSQLEAGTPIPSSSAPVVSQKAREIRSKLNQIENQQSNVTVSKRGAPLTDPTTAKRIRFDGSDEDGGDGGFQEDQRQIDVGARRRQKPARASQQSERPGRQARRQSEDGENPIEDGEDEEAPSSDNKEDEEAPNPADEGIPVNYEEVNGKAKRNTASERVRASRRRNFWDNAEINRLVEGIAKHGCGWAEIKSWDKAKGNILGQRDQVALKDKARNMKVVYLRARERLPENFEFVPLGQKEIEQVQRVRKDPPSQWR